MIWSMRGNGENWRPKRGSCRGIVCRDRVAGPEEMGSHRRSGGDVIMLRFALCTFEIQLWRLHGLEVERPAWAVGGGCGNDPGEQEED